MTNSIDPPALGTGVKLLTYNVNPNCPVTLPALIFVLAPAPLLIVSPAVNVPLIAL